MLNRSSNTNTHAVRLWILTTIAASIIKPPKWDVGDR